MFYLAPEDYRAESLPIIFLPDTVSSHIECVTISILFDELLENMESFNIFISTPDSAVQIARPYASVLIVDNTSKSYRTI